MPHLQERVKGTFVPHEVTPMEDRSIKIGNFPPVTEQELMAPVSVQEMKAVYSRVLYQAQQKQVAFEVPPVPLPLTVRCGLLGQLLGGAEPSDEQFAVMAEAPLDGSVPKEELLRKLGL